MLSRPKPSFLLNASSFSSWLITHRNSLPATHFFSTEVALESCVEDRGKGLPCSAKPSSSSDAVVVVAGCGAPDVVDKVELTKTLLRSYGFTNTHLSKLLSYRPKIFNSVPERTLFPKLNFYRVTVGFSNTDLPRFISSNPSLLAASLQHQIVPCYTFVKSLLLSDSDDDDEIVLNTLKRSPRILTFSVEKRIAPNIATLRAAGVPHKRILYLMRQGPSVLVSSSLGESIKRAAEMGLDPNKLSFVEAIRMFTHMSKSTWDKKMQVYRSCGFSDEEILRAFRTFPICMSLSEQNIEQTMDIIVNKMGLQPAYFVRDPALLTFSLQKRIIPRCMLVKYLQAKGLLRKDVSLRTILRTKEKDFIDKFVTKYEIDFPDLMDIYLGKISPPQDQIH